MCVCVNKIIRDRVMFKVTVNGNFYTAESGALLSVVLSENGIWVEHPCGGKGLCKKCRVKVNGRDELCCAYKINSDITVEIPVQEKEAREEGVDTSVPNESLCLCLDIGTTTLELALVDRKNKEILKTFKAVNPQTAMGADVISRIAYATENGTAALQKCVVNKMNELISQMGVEAVKKMYVSANTTMLHILFGEDCTSLGVAPYTPKFLSSKMADAKGLGIEGVKEVESLPCIDTFVGADIVAGVYFAGEPAKGKYNLLVDLGTNTEIVLWSEQGGVCTSAASGPCFEGGNISCGMRATKGAVCGFSEGSMAVIGNTIPKGLCASGLIDVVAHLIKKGKIDSTGYMAEDFSIAYGVSLTGEDVREYQVAKSAVYSGIQTLVNELKISFADIDKAYICGGFSQGLNIKNAVFTGLIPKELQEKCVLLGNSSLSGTVKYALGNGLSEKLLKKSKYIDLAEHPFFAGAFIKNMEVFS